MNPELAILGLCQKAGKLKNGTFQVEEAIKGGTARLVLVAEDASDNTKKNFYDAGEYYHVPVYTYGRSEEIGNIIGKENRVVVAVTDDKLACLVKSKLALR